jgi:hypothetical protein
VSRSAPLRFVRARAACSSLLWGRPSRQSTAEPERRRLPAAASRRTLGMIFPAAALGFELIPPSLRLPGCVLQVRLVRDRKGKGGRVVFRKGGRGTKEIALGGAAQP